MSYAIFMLVCNSILFFCVGRVSVQRSTAYRMGTKIVGDIQEILDRRKFIVDDMTITNTRGWTAFGFKWKISIEQEK